MYPYLDVCMYVFILYRCIDTEIYRYLFLDTFLLYTEFFLFFHFAAKSKGDLLIVTDYETILERMTLLIHAIYLVS